MDSGKKSASRKRIAEKPNRIALRTVTYIPTHGIYGRVSSLLSIFLKINKNFKGLNKIYTLSAMVTLTDLSNGTTFSPI